MPQDYDIVLMSPLDGKPVLVCHVYSSDDSTVSDLLGRIWDCLPACRAEMYPVTKKD